MDSLSVSPENWITWKESERNSISRRAIGPGEACALSAKINAHPGEHVAAGVRTTTIGIFPHAPKFDLKRDIFHQGNTMLWDAAVQRPDLFLNTVVDRLSGW